MESFSHKTKMRICAEAAEDFSCRRAELLGLICFSGIVVKLPGNKEELGLKIMLETEEIAERICLELAELYNISPSVKVKNSKVTLSLTDIEDLKKLKNGLKLQEDDAILYLRIDPEFVRSEEEKKGVDPRRVSGRRQCERPGKKLSSGVCHPQLRLRPGAG